MYLLLKKWCFSIAMLSWVIHYRQTYMLPYILIATNSIDTQNLKEPPRVFVALTHKMEGEHHPK